MQSPNRRHYWFETSALLVLGFCFWWWFIQPLWQSLFFSLLLAISFTPLFERLKRRIGEGKSAVVVVFITLLIPIIPLTYGIYYFVTFASELTQALLTAGTPERAVLDAVLGTVIAKVPGLEDYVANPSDLFSEGGFLRENLGGATTMGRAILGTVYSSALSVTFWIAVIMFGVYYLLTAGHKPAGFVRNILPIRPVFVDHMFSEFTQMTRAMVKVTLIVGTIQGTIGGTVLFLLGTPSAFMWTIAMIIFSMMPIAGAGVVLVPTAAIYFIIGNPFAGAVVAATFVFVSVIDNVLKPRIVGDDMEMHGGLILLSVVSGLVSFGAIGVFAGPIIAAFIKAFWDVYQELYSQELGDNAGHTAWQPLVPKVVVKNRPLR